MKKVLIWGDGACPTGFARVNHEIIKGLPEDVEVHHLAVNYHGDPHNYKHRLYPAGIAGDLIGYRRIQEFSNKNFDLIYILNDVWVIHEALSHIKKSWRKIPPIIVYIPVDAEEFQPDWFEHFDIVDTVVAYTEFGKRVIEKAYPDANCVVIPHGTNTNDFYQIDREKAKKIKFKSFPELVDSFIVLNANRNQPRKRLDVALKGFSLFSKDKPDNVCYYHHAGLRDAGWHIPTLIKRYKIQDRIILTNDSPSLQNIPISELNLIYNACDVGLNTSLGEGWGLTATEHAVTGAAQVVPDSSACTELWEDCGLLIPANIDHTYEATSTVGKLVTPEDVADQLQKLYDDRELLESLSYKGQLKFTQYEYSWEYVSRRFYEEFQKLW